MPTRLSKKFENKNLEKQRHHKYFYYSLSSWINMLISFSIDQVDIS